MTVCPAQSGADPQEVFFSASDIASHTVKHVTTNDLLQGVASSLISRIDLNVNVLGLGLGLLFVPCAGPVLATIAVVGASHRVSFSALILTAAFGVGVGLPLLVLALAGDKLATRTGVLRRHARRLRVVGGVVMILLAAAIAFNLTDGLQRFVPGAYDFTFG